MSEAEPFIDEKKRPKMAISPDTRLVDLTVADLQRLLTGARTQDDTATPDKQIVDAKLASEKPRSPEGPAGMLKFTSDAGPVQKNNNKDTTDKQSADNKAQIDFKVSTDKQNSDKPSSSTSTDSLDVLELLRHLVRNEARDTVG